MWFSLRLGLVSLALFHTFCGSFASAESSSAIEKLMAVEEKLLAQMVDYSSVLQKQISLMRRYISLMRVKNEQAAPDWEQYLANPLHSYSLIHHTHFDWTNWRRLMEQPLGREQLSKMRALMPQIPRTEYLNAKQDLIQEPLVGVQFDPLESLELALFAYDKDRADLAEQWLNVTLSGYQQLSPSKKELYQVLRVVEESKVQALYEKVKALNKNQSSKEIF